MERIEALVNPFLLSWARKTAGLGVEQAAKKAQVKAEKLLSWEAGDARPSLIQARKLGRVYKRPISVFYLPEPPQDFQPLRDFRRLPNAPALPESPQLLFEMRRAQARRDLAVELLEALEIPAPQLRLAIDSRADPEQMGEVIREGLGVSVEEQFSWRPGYETFNRWRKLLENNGVLVFQCTDVGVSEARGFSVYAEVLPAVVVNTKDSVPGRIFSMFHELTHILLREGGICQFHDAPSVGAQESGNEQFCNSVAGAALVPQSNLLAETLVRTKQPLADWPDDHVAYLAERYGVSRETLLRRLLICHRITSDFYQRKRQQYQQEFRQYQQELRRKSKRSTGPPPYRLAVSTAGHTFVTLVLDSYHQDRITASDVADFLGVRLKHLTRIQSEVLAGAR